MTDRKPFFETPDGAVRLYHGDCLEIMDELEPGQFHAIATDPPYSSGGAFRGDRTQTVAAKYVQSGSARFAGSTFAGDCRDQRGWAYWARLWLTRFFHLAAPGGYLLQFTDWRQLPTTTDIVQAAGWVWREIIERAGYTSTTRPEAKARPVSVWRLVYPAAARAWLINNPIPGREETNRE